MSRIDENDIDICKRIKEHFLYYATYISPVYSYLVALKGQKPLQLLIEIENSFAHIAQACQSIHVNSNLERAKNHLLRLEVDLYKLLLVELKVMLDNEPHSIKEFIKLSRQARETELNEIGTLNNKKVVKAYNQAINYAIDQLNLDPLIIQSVKNS